MNKVSIKIIALLGLIVTLWSAHATFHEKNRNESGQHQVEVDHHPCHSGQDEDGPKHVCHIGHCSGISGSVRSEQVFMTLLAKTLNRTQFASSLKFTHVYSNLFRPPIYFSGK